MINKKTQDLVNSVVSLIKNPIRGKSGRYLVLENIKFVEPDAANDINKQLLMKYEKNGTLEGHISARISIYGAKNELISKSGQIRSLIPIPIVTDRDTYIVNGGEKSVLSQMRLKPGVYTSVASDLGDVKTNIMVDNSANSGTKYVPQIIVTFSPSNLDFKITIKSRGGEKAFGGINFLRVIGFSDPFIQRLLGNGTLSDQIFKKQGNQNKGTILDVYKAIVGVQPNGLTIQQAKSELHKYLSENAKFRTGAPVIKANLGLSEDYLSADVIASAVKKTFDVAENRAEEDDKDDLRYKDVYDENDFLYEQIEQDWNAFAENARTVLDSNKEDIRYTDIRSTTKIGQSIKTFFSSSDLVQSGECTNPLFVISAEKKVTQLGTGGITKGSMYSETSARNVAGSSMNRIDPIETPESGNIGVIEHLSQSAKIEDRTIKSPVLVVNGKTASNSSEMYLTPDEEYHTVVAFNDSRYVKKTPNGYEFIKTKVPSRYMNKIEERDISKIKYIDRNPRDVLGFAANLIPFVSHDDGNRAMMGANMQKQAIVLKNREVPMVGNIMDDKTGKTYEQYIGEISGRPVVSDVDGVVDSVKNGVITINGSDGKKYKKNYYEYFPVNQSYINNEPVVSAGTAVKKGDLLAEGWQTKHGTLALGLNARVGYMPFDGRNYEDGIVVSRSFAKAMTTEELEDYEVMIPRGMRGGRGSRIKEELGTYTRDPLARGARFDADGIIKVGQYVKAGDTMVSMLRPIAKNSDNLEDAILSADKNLDFRYAPAKIESGSYIEGEVKRITVIENPDGSNKQKIVFSLVCEKPLKVQDKISGRHGNKGTINRIVPDEEMPVAEDGKRIDVLFSPLAVPSRKNVGQILEVNAGLVAEKTGKPYNIHNFDHKEKEKVQDDLKKIGFEDGKMNVILKRRDENGNLIDVPTENKVTVGNMYVMKLKHKIDEKIQARSNLESDPSFKTHMPSKRVGSNAGEKHNPQGLGEMELRGLQAHQSVWNILENTTIKSDGGGDKQQRMAIFNAIATGKLDDADMPATPESLHILSDSLKGLGLNAKPMYNGKEVDSFDDIFDSIAIQPLKSSEILKMTGKNAEVTEAKLFNAKDVTGEVSKAKNKNVTGKDDIAISGGLVDPNIFGDSNDVNSRKKWGYIKLAVPQPNPQFMKDSSYNPYSILTGIKKDQLTKLSSGKLVMIADPDKYAPFANLGSEVKEKHKRDMREAGLTPGMLVEPYKIEKLTNEGKYILWQAGGEAFQTMLDAIDVDKELDKAKKELKNAKNASSINKVFKKVKVLTNLHNTNTSASDLLLRYVPVTPTYLRPVMQTDDKKSYIVNDLNKLYGSLIQSNNPLKADTEMGDLYQSRDVISAANGAGNIYNRLSDLFGATVKKDIKKKKELQGIEQTLTEKNGLIRGNMLSKKVDFSGRSVIGVDPSLRINEAAIPLDMAKQIYKPFIERELIDQGFVATEMEARRKLEKMDEDVKQVIKEVADDRPIVLNRQPTLHRLGILAFKPIISETEDGSKVRSIRLNPLCVEGFNADFDGDTMAAHVPVTEKAKEEAKKLMMPSENLINPTDGKLIINIRHEMVLGIYYITNHFDKPEGKAISYSDYSKLTKDYELGRISSHSAVNFDGKSNITAGQAMFNHLLPEKYRNYKTVWGKKQITDMLYSLYSECEENNWKTMSKIKFCDIVDNIKDLGFMASTRSGVSIGVTDFKKIENLDSIIKSNIASAKKTYGNTDEAVAIGYTKAEKEIEDKLKNGSILDSDNPLQIMMASGARASAGQVRRMIGMVGNGMDINKKIVQPIRNSNFDGLGPGEYMLHGKDCRKGMSDRSVATQKPGEITRTVWSGMQDVIIKEVDCKTKGFIEVNTNANGLIGRIVAEDIVSSGGKILAKRNQMITRTIYNDIYKEKDLKKIKIRSPLKCKTPNGCCQYCYGSIPGTLQLPKEGTPIGILSSHAMGEPVMQMTMNTFHTGGGASGATIGLPRISKILSLGADKSLPAVLATNSGTVTKIEHGVTQDFVYINNKAHIVPKINGKSQPLKVSVGDMVVKGDFLTIGDLNDLHEKAGSDIVFTNADPKKLFEYKASTGNENEALDYVQNYLADSMNYAFAKATNPGSIDSRHVETIVSKLTSKAKVLDSGDSKYLKGDVVDRNEILKFNESTLNPYVVKKLSLANANTVVGHKSGETYKDKLGKIIVAKNEVINDMAFTALKNAGIKEIKVFPSPIQYQVDLESINTVGEKGNSNWFGNMAGQKVMSKLVQGAVTGQVDKLDNPRARMMAGKILNIGEGFKMDKDKSNSISSRMLNFFSKSKA